MRETKLSILSHLPREGAMLTKSGTVPWIFEEPLQDFANMFTLEIPNKLGKNIIHFNWKTLERILSLLER